VVKAVLSYAVLLLFALIAVVPFVYLLSPSFRQSYELFTYPPQWIPDTLYWGNFSTVLNETSYYRWGLNTLVFATSVTLITLVIDTLAGYAFARLRFPGRTVLFALVISTLMIPTAAVVAPLYIMVSHMPGWTHAGVNTYLGLILPMVCSPLGVFMMRQFISTLPEGLVEAARLDGASEFQIFRKIVLPLMKPAIVVLGIFTFMFQWVNFLWPLVITTTDSMKTLTVGIASLQGQFVTDWGVISAAAVMTMLPVIIVFLIFQRWFVQASMAGALKQ
jgi:ABC-type glycerol-3-phosphate transport system permease component